MPALLIGAIALVLSMLIPVVPQILNEVFWLRALNRPERNLRRILEHASITEAERPMRMLRRARRDVLRTRERNVPRRVASVSAEPQVSPLPDRGFGGVA